MNFFFFILEFCLITQLIMLDSFSIFICLLQWVFLLVRFIFSSVLMVVYVFISPLYVVFFKNLLKHSISAHEFLWFMLTMEDLVSPLILKDNFTTYSNLVSSQFISRIEVYQFICLTLRVSTVWSTVILIVCICK
jgi:hypothetical protein